MENRFKLVYIIFFILLFSCKTEKSIFGIYSSENFGRIELKSDSTFKYRGGTFRFGIFFERCLAESRK